MKWCNNCNAHKESWAEHPDYRSSDTYRRYDRCWSCDKWTLCNCHHGCCNHGAYEALRRAEDRNSSLISQNSSLQSDLASKNTQITRYATDLANTQTKLAEKEGQLTVKTRQLETLTGLFNELKIESNNKDREIENKEKNIKNLEVKLVGSQEEVSNYKIKEQERKLDDFIQQLGIGRENPRELRKAYQRLIKARENYNQDNIDRAEDEIEKIKDELLSSGWFRRGMSLENVQKLCSKCEKLASLKIEQGKIQEQKWQQQQEQQQYEAQQEVPPHNNN